jgi:uracil phosphoribosyltransferase
LYYAKLPKDIESRYVLLLDPMLGKLHILKSINNDVTMTNNMCAATGGSAMQAVQVLLDNNVREDRIIFLNLISAPEGIDAFVQRFPQIKIITGEIDGGLDDNKYIVPGVGDFGCR